MSHNFIRAEHKVGGPARQEAWREHSEESETSTSRGPPDFRVAEPSYQPVFHGPRAKAGWYLSISPEDDKKCIRSATHASTHARKEGRVLLECTVSYSDIKCGSPRRTCVLTSAAHRYRKRPRQSSHSSVPACPNRYLKFESERPSRAPHVVRQASSAPHPPPFSSSRSSAPAFLLLVLSSGRAGFGVSSTGEAGDLLLQRGT